MAYSSGSLIEATDYNGFVNVTSNANLNDIYGTGTGDKGYGQTPLSTVAAQGTITATQWASLVNALTLVGNHQGTSITARTAPTAGETIQILAALNTDLTTLTTNRNNAAASGTEYGTFSGTTSKTTATGSGTSAWTITFTHTITFASAAAARYFFNAGGLVRVQFGKTSTGTDADDEWNDLANTLCGDIFLSGAAASKSIAGQAYTGTTKIGGSGTPTTLNTAIGFFDLQTTDTTIYKQFADTPPYTTQFIEVKAKVNNAHPNATVITFTTLWTDPGGSGAGSSDNISGGTATSSPSTTITGTAPTTLVTYRPPSSTYLTASWGTPTIAASVA
jgi:hypothetical protein